MEQLPRERIALVVFCACILLIVAGIAAYMFAGHSWNHAASRIDDAAGEMEGYRVVLFDGTAIPEQSRVNNHGLLADQSRALDSVEYEYRQKEATTFALDSMNLEAYAEPTVLERGGYRIGVIYIEPDDTTRTIQAHADYLESHGCNAVIAFSGKALDEAECEGLDIVVDLHSDGSRKASDAKRDSTVVTMPCTGNIGAIVISPSDVVSFKHA